jgi:sodium-dependent dicarboxylate transporter 2/3/5
MRVTAVLRARIQWTGLFAGPLLGALCFLSLPHEYRDASQQIVPFSPAGRATLSVMVWMGTWWLSEAINISATALLPLALFPLLGISDMESTAAPYANPLIFLFMGGFLLALSMERWDLGKRIALLTLTCFGPRPVFMVAGFMIVTAVFSAFMSNTATTAMMLPIAIGVLGLVEKDDGQPLDEPGERPMGQFGPTSNLAMCLMLGIAYAASVGGVATIIGTPPNVFLVGFLEKTIATPYRTDISFARWLLVGVPLTAVFLPIILVLLTRVLFPVGLSPIVGGRELIRAELQSLGPPNRGQWITSVVFLITATLWITRPWLTQLGWGSGSNAVRPLAGLTDPGIAMTAALVLFVIPVDRKSRTFVLDWATARRLPWGILVLFGGGLSLALAVENNSVAEFIGSYTTSLAGVPDVVLVVLVAALVIFLTELTSNTATTAALLPVLAAVAPAVSVHPYLLVFPAAIAASCAFMLPVATPPNAIVFASGHVTLPQMARAGIWLNLIGIAVITALTFLVIKPLFLPGA